jgi:hypothetical protein
MYTNSYLYRGVRATIDSPSLRIKIPRAILITSDDIQHPTHSLLAKYLHEISNQKVRSVLNEDNLLAIWLSKLYVLLCSFLSIILSFYFCLLSFVFCLLSFVFCYLYSSTHFAVFEKHKVNSKWAPFLSVQPQSYDNILYFTKDEVALLQGSNLEQYVSLLLNQVQSDYKIIFEEALFQEFPEIFPRPKFSFDEYLWALSTVWSRAYDLPRQPQQKQNQSPQQPSQTNVVRTIVPFGDMFNHCPNSKNRHSFCQEDNAMVYEIVEPSKSGNQIFINYGPFSNAKLLKVYGFALENNPFDEVEIWAAMDQSAPFYERKIEILQKFNLTYEKVLPFRLTRHGIPGELITVLRVQFLEEDEFVNVEWTMQRRGVSRENDNMVKHFLLSSLQSMIKNYPTTVDQDKLFLNVLQTKLSSLTTPNTKLFRQVSILRTRLGEKEILQTSIDYLLHENSLFGFQFEGKDIVDKIIGHNFKIT